uniref:Uncharacterized protein n=1 Tax=Romanomermis culicivorax TaxID=13658 RepID=A0A915L0I0_ROMCU
MSKVNDAADAALKQDLVEYGKGTLGISGKYFDVLYQVFGDVLGGKKSAAVAAKGHKNWRQIFG